MTITVDLGRKVTKQTKQIIFALCPGHISYVICTRNLKFSVMMHLGMIKCRIPLLGHCDLELDL